MTWSKFLYGFNAGNADLTGTSLPMFTILIVDDEPQISHMMRRLFERVGWHAACVDDSRNAAVAVEKLCVDAVLLDMMMPGIDGFGVLQQIRTNPATAHVPVVLYSALSDENVISRAKALGADDYIVKTTPMQQIIDRLGKFAHHDPAGRPKGLACRAA